MKELTMEQVRALQKYWDSLDEKAQQLLLEESLAEVMKEEALDCPRCGKELDQFPALSRVDNKTDICSPCGTEEALDDYFGVPLQQFNVV